jgi:hypothetical protein
VNGVLALDLAAVISVSNVPEVSADARKAA